MQFLARTVSRWWTALACVAVVAAAMLLGGLGAFGLWEPQERQLADKADKPPPPVPAPAPAPPPQPGAIAPPVCNKLAPRDAEARSLDNRAIVLGKDLSDSDGGRRLPFALLGLLTVLATAGIAMRLAGPRAGVLAALVVLSMPLLVFQSRQLDSEIGTAAGGALAIYGLISLRSLDDLIRALPLGLAPPKRPLVWAAIDVVIGMIAFAGGVELGFLSGGALLGVLAPVGAYAAAGAFGLPTLADLARFARNAATSTIARVRPRFAIGRDLWPYRRGDNTPALLATAVAAVVLTAIVYQIFALHAPQPGMVPPERELLGHAIVAPGCYSPALGGAWRPDDDLRMIYDSTFEQIAYGTFPWGVLAPIAFASLLAMAHKGRRALGTITLAWASAAWLASELFQRKVGFTLYAGFPALAAALGGWLDAMLETRVPIADRIPRGALLIGTFAVLAIVDLGKDLQSFTEKLSSLLVGADAIAYPTQSQLLFVSTRIWIFALGALFAFGFAVALGFARSSSPLGRRTSRIAAIVAGATTIAFAAFWSFGWQPALATNLSSKSLFDTIESLVHPGDQLVIMGDLGGAPHDYAPQLVPEPVTGREQVVAALTRPNRVFAIAPQTELCTLHRELAGKPYFVIDDRNVRELLLSNRVDGTTDKNPLRLSILHAEPTQIAFRPKGRVVWESRIQLLGWDLPKSVHRGSSFEITLYYKILQPVGGSWTTILHFDGPQGRAFSGDHPPIDGRCQTSTWSVGDFIVDRHTVAAGNAATSRETVDVWTGFFTGTNPNFKNMPISEAPGDMRDPTDRVKITTITLD